MLSSRLKPLNLMAATAAIGIVGAGAAHAQEAAASTISAGDTAWLLISCALVMLMTPGLAFFMRAWFAAKTLYPPYSKTTFLWR
jgi:hypothetical protein